jgi:P-type Ca2+ transporter type 2C
MPDSAQNTAPTNPSTSFNPDNRDKHVYSLKKEQVLEKLKTNIKGLTKEEVFTRLEKFGSNTLTTKKKISALSIFLEQFKNTLTLILIGAAILILFIYFFGEKDPSDLIEAGLILAIILLITIMGFVQEYKAEKSIESLKKLLAFKAKVRRDGVDRMIDISELVPGDIVVLEEGEKVPADIRLLEVYSLSVNEASLTGESSAASKIADVINGEKQLGDQKNMVFSGTAIASGRAIGVVVETGDRTEIGKIAVMVAETDDDETPIQKRLDQIGKTIGYIILGICAVVFVFIMFFASDYQDLPFIQKVVHSFIASVALAVAAIPEGLPAVVTISLALGTQRMLKKNALVRKLNSVETLGSVDVICSDKTGTLTKGEMTVTEIFYNNQIYHVSGTGYETLGKFTKDTGTVNPLDLELLLKCGLNCNNSEVSKNTVLGDPTEAALLVSAAKAGINQKDERVVEVPFTSERKFMSVVVKYENGYRLYAKGAPEIVLQKSNQIFLDGKSAKLTDEMMTSIHNHNLQFSSKALRDLGFAYKDISVDEFKKLAKTPEEFEKDLVFLGIQGMMDPPRVEVKPLVETCKQSGIRVIMITGDHIETAKAVAHEIGIEGEALSGEELDKLSDEEFAQKVEQINIYARVNPSFKMRIVDHLKQKGHIVAMTGDGVNDAPALKKADIGIAMGITGTDVAKEASDMVLMDDHFSTIVGAIEEGRGIFHNIRKFVNYLLACNIGEVLVVFLAIIIFKELPLTATMLLWINVVTDGVPAVALGLDPAEKGIMRYKPKVFQSEIINRRLWVEMFIFGILLTIGVLGIYTLNLSEGMLEAKGAAFTAIVIFELVKLYLIRSNYNTSFFSNKWLFLAVIGTLVLQMLIIYVPFFANLFEIRHIDLFDWSYILGASIVLWAVFKIIQRILDRIPSLQRI